LFVNNRARQLWIEKTFYEQRNAFVLQRLYCFWMYYLCTIIGHLNYFVETQFTYKLFIGKLFWVCAHYTFYVFPDCLAFCIKKICKYSGGIIASFTTKCCAFIFICTSNEALC